jgi:hypothetical protein
MNTVELQPDAIDVLFEMMFEDELVEHPVDEFDEGTPKTECFFYSFYDLSMHCVKAALVCKKWNQAYKDCLKRYFEKEAAKIRQTAVRRALAMYGLSRYEVDDARDMEQHTQELHEVQLNISDHLVISIATLQLTRWDVGDGSLQRLTVECSARAQMVSAHVDFFEYFVGKNNQECMRTLPARVEVIPQACFEDPANLTLAQREMIETWKQDFAEATTLWLLTQRDAEGQEAEIAAWKRDFGAWFDARRIAQGEDEDSE